jgi:hypothetical protein
MILMRFMGLVVTQCLKDLTNAAGVRKLQPGVARASALPWETTKTFVATLKGLPRASRKQPLNSRILTSRDSL